MKPQNVSGGLLTASGPAPHTTFLPPFHQEVKPAGDAALVPPPLHIGTAEGQRGHYLSSPSQESTAMMSTLSQTDTAESGEGSRIIHDELRDHAWTSTTTVLEGDTGLQESGCDPQPNQTSGPSYLTT